MHGDMEPNEPAANLLCKSCGLCCTGHLFIRTKLRSAELDAAQALGLNVLGSDPNERAFHQPCPLWQGECTIYTSPHYPRFCRTFKCKLLKELSEETTSLRAALAQVQQAKQLIHEVEALLPDSSSPNFRERLETELENPGHVEFHGGLRPKADDLLILYREVFGVKDFIDRGKE